MNMEKLALEIANEHMKKMTDNNIEDEIYLKEKKVINNIKNGFVVVTQLSTFFESFLNDIILNCIEYEGELLLKRNIEEKIEFIFWNYRKDFSVIKGQHCWEVFKKAVAVRNEMTHFKRSHIGDSSGIPNFIIGRSEVGPFFTKTNMDKLISETLILSKKIAVELGLKINENIDIFTCDGQEVETNYIREYNKEEIIAMN